MKLHSTKFIRSQQSVIVKLPRRRGRECHGNVPLLPFVHLRDLFDHEPDKSFDGEMWTREGLRVKYLPQEPDLDSSLNVMENIRRGIAEQVGESLPPLMNRGDIC